MSHQAWQGQPRDTSCTLEIASGVLEEGLQLDWEGVAGCSVTPAGNHTPAVSLLHCTSHRFQVGLAVGINLSPTLLPLEPQFPHLLMEQWLDSSTQRLPSSRGILLWKFLGQEVRLVTQEVGSDPGKSRWASGCSDQGAERGSSSPGPGVGSHSHTSPRSPPFIAHPTTWAICGH